MAEGTLCNRKTIDTKEDLKALMADNGGKLYYKEMEELDVDQEKLWATIQGSLKSRLKTWLEICAHCGMCADSCFLYTANDKDPTQVPSYKIHSTLGAMVKRKGKVDNEFMRMTMDTAWSKCTCCTRCGVYCPMGIDMGVMFGYVRGLCFSQGFVPWEMKIGSGMHRVYKAQMDVTTEDWVDTVEFEAEGIDDEYKNMSIPVDKENADIMYTLNAREAKHYPEDITEAAILFNLAGENWTVPSEGWEQTSLSMFAGDWASCKAQVENVYSAMERLKPKRMIGTECGHAHRATVIEGPYWAGYESGQPPVESIHYVEWVAEVLRTGKLKLDPSKKIKEPVTLQDSCNYVRNGGLGEITREIMSYIAEDFREMTPKGQHNYCCGGGGGFNGIGKYHHERNIGLKIKMDQILATDCKLVISPCHNCWDAIRDMAKVYSLDIKWSFLKPILLDMAIIPDKFKLDDEDED